MAATARAVDLTGVSEGGNFRPRRKPEGDYRAKFVKADDHQPKDKTKPAGWVMTVQIEGDSRSTYPVYLNPAEKERWKIFQACRAAGFNIQPKRFKFDPNKLVGKAIGVYLEDDEFEGRLKSVIGEMFLASEVGANADEDAPEDEDEVVDEDEDDTISAYGDEDESDVPDDEEEEEEPEPTPPPRKRTTRRKPEPEPEPEEEDEEDEDEEEPAPPPRRTRKAAAAPTRRRKPAPEPEDDEDGDLDLDDLDD